MTKRITISDAIENYVQLRVNIALLDYDLTTTLDGREKKKNKMEPELYQASRVMNRRIKRLYDQAAKARGLNSGKSTTR
jgi:hypothetical protein